MKRLTILVVLAVFLVLSLVMTAWSATQVLGGTQTEGNLLVTIYDNGQIGVQRYVSGSWQDQFFSTSAKGSRIQTSDNSYSFGYYAANSYQTAVSNVRSGNQVVTTWTAGPLNIAQSVSYVDGSNTITYQWTIKNESLATVSDLRFFHGGDTYLGGNDSGPGYYDATRSAIGTSRTINNQYITMDLQAITPHFAYESTYYYQVAQDVSSGALSNYVETNSVDNGYAMEWRYSSLSPGATWSITAVERFSGGNYGDLAIDTSSLNNKNVGGSLFMDAFIPVSTQNPINTFYLEKNGVFVAKTTVPDIASASDLFPENYLGRYGWKTMGGAPVTSWAQILTETSFVPFRLIAVKSDGAMYASQVFNLAHQSTLLASFNAKNASGQLITFPQPGQLSVTFTAAPSGGTAPYTYRWLLDNGYAFSTAISGTTILGDVAPSKESSLITLVVTDSAGNTQFVQDVAYIDSAWETGNPAESGSGSKLINGVDVSNGNLFLAATDITVPGKGVAFALGRSYNSSKALNVTARKWRFNYDQKIEFPANKGGREIQIYREDGREDRYYRDVDGLWYGGRSGMFDRLVEKTDGSFTLYTKGSTILNFTAPNSSGVASLASISDRDGNALLITTVSTTQKLITDSAGRQYALDYDASGRLIKATDFTGRYVQYTYDANGNLITVRDLRGNTTQYAYNSDRQLLSIREPLALAASPQYNSVTVSYDASGRVQYFDDASGNRTEYQYGTIDSAPATAVIRPKTNGGTINNNAAFVYDTIGRVTDEINALNIGDYRAKRQYNSATIAKRTADQGLVGSITTPRNYSTTFTYSDDGRGNKTGSTNPLNQKTDYSHKTEADYSGALPNLNVMSSFKTPLNNSYAFDHEPSGSVKTITTPVSAATNFTYGTAGLLQSVKDPNNNSTAFEYDANGNTQTVTDANSKATSYTYDNLGRVVTATDRRGVITQYTYDAAGNVLTTTSAYGTPRAATVTNTYDVNGNLATVKDARNNIRTYTYTKDNRLATESYTSGGTTYTRTNIYDELGRLWKVTNENNHTSQSDFDAGGRKTSETDAQPATTTYTYDNNGNVLTKTDPLGHVTTYTYDELDRVKTVKDHLNNTVTYSYDAEGNLQSVTDPKGQVTSYSYYADGKLKTVTDPNSGVTTATYDAAGNLKTVSGPKSGNLVTYNYDALNRMTSMVDAGNRTWSFTYDENGNLLTQTVPGTGTTQYQYDELNRVTRVTWPDSSTVQYGYDLNGNRISMVDASGTTSYVYDEANRVTSVTDPFGKVVSYTYDGVGNVKRVVYPGTKNLDYNYDAVERLATVTNWLNHTTTYSYNKIHQLTQIANANATKATFAYDNANRLISLQNLKSSNAVISSHSNTLDANGNLQQSTVTLPLQPTFNTANTSLAFDVANRIITSGSTSFIHDLAGRIVAETTAGATKNYSYNHRDLITAITGSTDTYSYIYNGDGNRIAMTKNGVQTRYVLDLNQSLPDVLAETNSAGTVTAYYTYGNGLISKIDAAGQEQWYHFDPTGNTLALTDSSQNVTDSYAYTPYGEITVQGSSWNPFKYSGKHGVMDDGNGLNYMRARYYKPEIARFMSLDAVWGDMDEPQSLNRFAYVQGDPMGKVDPSGMILKWLAGKIGGGIMWGSIQITQIALGTFSIAADGANKMVCDVAGCKAPSLDTYYQIGGWQKILNSKQDEALQWGTDKGEKLYDEAANKLNKAYNTAKGYGNKLSKINVKSDGAKIKVFAVFAGGTYEILSDLTDPCPYLGVIDEKQKEFIVGLCQAYQTVKNVKEVYKDGKKVVNTVKEISFNLKK
ncbi:RHS repeat protein [Trichlorobacter lovleyi]|uniref:RHS repeat-associated core domain-containing protein n=1 Tax=Trichlorobacter lovleyi TaxID=313985 RepID=UPI00223FDB26|nr:RHS repeat-associated core domain-containing protein [Trichlorobacter lovleyi]QOX79863.1 RHS repeat protein [Trichlorobacter lovleyi]